MRVIMISVLAGAAALSVATAANAGSLIRNGLASGAESSIDQVRMVCDSRGRCYDDRRGRRGRVVIRQRETYGYAPRYQERRVYREERPSIGFRAPGVSVGIGTRGY